MELTDYLRAVRAHWLGITIAVVVAIAGAAAYTAIQPRIYTATSSGYVAATGASDLGSSMLGDQLAKSKVKSYLDIGGWRTVAEHAIAELSLDSSPEALVSRVSVTNPTDTVVISVSARAGSPEAARDLAEAWIRGMISEIEGIEGASGAGVPITLIPGDSARLPTAPSSPNVRQNLALGLLLGLLAGAGYAILRDHLDRKIRSADGVEKATGLAVVGALPLEASMAKSPRLLPLGGDARSSDLSVLSEAFRGLRTNLQYMSVDDPPRAIVITSPLPGDGKSFTAANLAITLAAAGQPTVLIDADLRKPRVAAQFGLSPDAGLSDVLAGRVDAEDVLQPVGESEDLLVLAAGPIPPNPSEILGSEKMQQLIANLSRDALVILDAPPLLPVTDSAVLSTRVDGTLIVASTGGTTYEVLEKALGILDRAHGKPLGVVLNRVPRSGKGALYYGYQYTDSYGDKPVPAPSRLRRHGGARRAA